MKFTRLVFTLMFTALAMSLAAHAQPTRTWVSGVGDDANPCSRTAPCKTFAGAISKTATGGEIDVLDPGGFGAVTITKSITIDGGGGQVGSVLTIGTNGIVVAALPGSVVTLRNLQLQGLYPGGNGSGLNGIQFTAGAALHIEHCAIYGFENGIYISPDATASVYIDNTTVQDNSQTGVWAASSSTVHVLVTNSHFSNNSLYGIEASDNSIVTVHGSDADGNGIAGFFAFASSNPASMTLFTSAAAANGAEALLAGGGGASATITSYTSELSDNPKTKVIQTNGHITAF